MSEAWAWTIVFICLYLMGYLIFGMITNDIWQRWAWGKVGQFWDYGLRKGMKIYYPTVWCFVQECNLAYSILRVAFWPVTIPVQLVLQTKAINRLSARKYYY